VDNKLKTKLRHEKRLYRKETVLLSSTSSEEDFKGFLMDKTGATRDDNLAARRAAGDKSAYPRKENS
jgi:hypothetical protein